MGQLLFIAPLFYQSIKGRDGSLRYVIPVGGVGVMVAWPALMFAWFVVYCLTLRYQNKNKPANYIFLSFLSQSTQSQFSSYFLYSITWNLGHIFIFFLHQEFRGEIFIENTFKTNKKWKKSVISNESFFINGINLFTSIITMSNKKMSLTQSSKSHIKHPLDGMI